MTEWTVFFCFFWNRNDTLSGVEAKKRRSFNGQSKFDLESAEEEEDEEDEEEEGKASRAKEDPDSIDRRSSQLVANLINQLNEEDLKAATSQLTQQLLEAIREEILDDGRRYKYAAGPRQIKRVAHKKSLRKRAGFRPNLQKRTNSFHQFRYFDVLRNPLNNLLVTANTIICDSLKWFHEL